MKENGGDEGIRTLDGLMTHTPLAGERLRPLGHVSVGGTSEKQEEGQALIAGNCVNLQIESLVSLKRYYFDRLNKANRNSL